MTENEPDSMLVHCGWCRHEWFALKLPMPIAEAAEKMIAMRCPECDKNLIYCGPAPAYGDDINTFSKRVKKREKVNMSDDLVKRLRELACNCYDAEVIEAGKDAMDEAASRIEKLEAALRPFAKWADWHDDAKGTDVERCFSKAQITVGELRAARKALEGKDDAD